LPGANRIFLSRFIFAPTETSHKRGELAEVASVGLESVLRKASLDPKIGYVLLDTAQQ
jgi:hypothetical protein